MMDKELEADIRAFLDAAEQTFGKGRFVGSPLWVWAANRGVSRAEAMARATCLARRSKAEANKSQ